MSDLYENFIFIWSIVAELQYIPFDIFKVGTLAIL